MNKTFCPICEEEMGKPDHAFACFACKSCGVWQSLFQEKDFAFSFGKWPQELTLRFFSRDEIKRFAKLKSFQ